MNERSKSDLLDFLDGAIEYWRHELKVCAGKKDSNAMFPSMESTVEIKAKCYIDAYQSMKIYVVTNTSSIPGEGK